MLLELLRVEMEILHISHNHKYIYSNSKYHVDHEFVIDFRYLKIEILCNIHNNSIISFIFHINKSLFLYTMSTVVMSTQGNNQGNNQSDRQTDRQTEIKSNGFNLEDKAADIERIITRISYVKNRMGKQEVPDIRKISNRLEQLRKHHPTIVDIDVNELAYKVLMGLSTGMTTSEIDNYSAIVASSMAIRNPLYLKLAGRIVIDNHRKNTLRCFFDKVKELYYRRDDKDEICPLVNYDFYKYVEKNQDVIESMIDYKRDDSIDYFGFKTMESSYLMKVTVPVKTVVTSDGSSITTVLPDNTRIGLPLVFADGKIAKVVERPQDAMMRIAIAIHMNMYDDMKEELKYIKNTYDLLSTKCIMHASPTWFNAGSQCMQLASCFLLGLHDSRKGIMKCADKCSEISKWGGGIGVHLSNLRSRGTLIRGTNGMSNGPIPFIKIFEVVAYGFNQGGKRNGSFSIYMELHHPDILEFLELRLPGGDPQRRAQGLFTAVWISDLFMERLINKQKWSLFDPDTTVDLSKMWGDEYRKTYLALEAAGRAKKVVDATTIWEAIYHSKVKTGIPYILYKDTANRVSNQSNLGTIRSSNLCAEIIEYSNEEETAVCNLASVCLPSCVVDTYTDEEYMKVQQELLADERNQDYDDEASTISQAISEKDTTDDNEKNNQNNQNNQNNVDSKDVESQESQAKLPPLDKELLDKYIKKNFARLGIRELNHEFPVNPKFDFERLGLATKTLVRNLNNVIDKATYVDEETKRSNLRHRPIGIGVQGLADVYMKFRFPFDDPRANSLNKKIFETMYYYSLSESTRMSREKYKAIKRDIKEKGHHDFVEYSNPLEQDQTSEDASVRYFTKTVRLTSRSDIPTDIGAYPSYKWNGGSQLSKGIFHWHHYITADKLTCNYDWDTLEGHIKQWGVRNSLTMAIMPTATTSQVMGNNECVEPYTANIYKRTVLSGEYVVINKYLMRDLYNLGLWNNDVKNRIIMDQGSVRNLPISDELKNLYKIARELDQEALIKQSISRQPFIDQSQSLNLYVDILRKEDFNKWMLMAFKHKLITASYYIHTNPAARPQMFNMSVKDMEKRFPEVPKAALADINSGKEDVSKSLSANTTKTNNLDVTEDQKPRLAQEAIANSTTPVVVAKTDNSEELKKNEVKLPETEEDFTAMLKPQEIVCDLCSA